MDKGTTNGNPREPASALGDIVKVTVDRPLGSFHPQYQQMRYPVNYGYVAGVFAADGEEQDAYILGMTPRSRSLPGK